MEIKSDIAAIAGQCAYMKIPASEIRKFVDASFPMFSKDIIADAVRGQGHRFKHGHDILLDVSKTIKEHGVERAIKHAGHIVLTDFPTQAGVPIPSLSANGLGGWIHETLGVSKVWLSLNISDVGFGLLAVTEGYMDLLQACSGELLMDSTWVFVDTFVVGSIEIAIGVLYKSPFFVVAGFEKIFAGFIAISNSIENDIALATCNFLIKDPFEFFGYGTFGCIIGIIISTGINGYDLKKSTLMALRTGIIFSLASISPFLSIGVSIGLIAFKYGEKLSSEEKSFDGSVALLEEVKKSFPDIDYFSIKPQILNSYTTHSAYEYISIKKHYYEFEFSLNKFKKASFFDNEIKLSSEIICGLTNCNTNLYIFKLKNLDGDFTRGIEMSKKTIDKLKE